MYSRLGDMLVGVGVITEEQLQAALKEQKGSGKKLGTVLIEKGFIDQMQLFKTLERQLGIDFIDLNNISIPGELASLIPRSIAKKHNIIPISANDTEVSIAMDEPLNFMAIEEVKAVTKRKVVPMLATTEGITREIANLYGSETAEKALEDLKTGESGDNRSADKLDANVIGTDDENAAPTIRLVNSFLEYAVNQNCSDIHMEPRETKMVIRMRIDGTLRQVFEVPKSSQNAVVARVKVMGNMNIAEHKIPLDGRSNIRVNGKDVDLRISTLPTIYGEKVVIRMLYKSTALLSTAGIGLTGKNLKKFNTLLENSNGVILIVGPTGSGKSSSMYTMIRQLNTESVNLVTLEDPVEYNINGINQVQINDKTGMTFASGLRSILRQDPDIIAVGEIRDGETAQIAMRSAITGHLVLSTLHTNDAPSTLDRLLDIGVDGYLIAAALKGVVSQRLVRKICPNCKVSYDAPEEEQTMLKLPYVPGRKFYKGKGCPQCSNQGYKGRTAVFEILTLNAEVKRAIADNVSHSELMKAIESSDFEPMVNDCARLVCEGVTTYEQAFATVNSTDA